jgi:hypothetical protein
MSTPRANKTVRVAHVVRRRQRNECNQKDFTRTRSASVHTPGARAPKALPAPAAAGLALSYEETMSQARLKRLEARQPKGRPWFDVTDMCLRLWAAFDAEHAATRAGREFSRVPRPERELSEAERDAFDHLVAEVDMMHCRLSEKLPEST